MSRIVVIDADRNIARQIGHAVGPACPVVASAVTAKRGLELIAEIQPDLIFVDLTLPGASQNAVFDDIKRLAPQTPVIVVNTDGASGAAIQAIQSGAYDFVMKPINARQIRTLIQQALARNGTRYDAVATADVEGVAAKCPMVGKSPPMIDVYKAIGRVALQNISVVIRGESGTGKELIARAIHEHSARSQAPFLAVNCAALPDGLLASELFGHEKGSFTGADCRRIGRFEQCSGGTLFLDEVGDMSPALQAKLLRVLQARNFERVGGNETIKTDVRIIAATHRDLSNEERFRADLYYRLNGFAIAVPPLRERPDDVAILLDNFFNVFGSRLGKRITGITPEARRLLTQYRWPGNVRELQNAVRHALLHMTGSVITVETLPAELRSEQPRTTTVPAPVKQLNARDTMILERLVEQRLRAGSTNLYGEAVETLDEYVLAHVLRVTAGNQSKAAEILGISRRSLRQKRELLNIQIQTVVSR